MSDRPDGGSAFPVTLSTEIWADLHKSGKHDVLKNMCGMSLRDWLAGQAMAALIARGEFNYEDACRMAVIHADQMLVELEK